MPKVFISHSSDDAVIARALAELLRDAFPGFDSRRHAPLKTKQYQGVGSPLLRRDVYKRWGRQAASRRLCL